MDVAVYYDSCFGKKFGSKAKTRIRAIMAIVDEMYSEKDTLQGSYGSRGFYTKKPSKISTLLSFLYDS